MDPATHGDDDGSTLREIPVADVIAAYILHLLRVAASHLASDPPDLTSARLAIDAAGALIAVGEDRLGEHVALFRQALGEAHRVFAHVSHPRDDTPRT